MKKILASIIAVVLAVSGLSVISITANAATIFISGNYEYTVNSDDTVNIAGYKGIATDITIPSQILNKNVVGLYKDLKDLDSKTGITLLAGHNNIYVFKNLNKLKIGDEVIIGSKFYTYKYKVVSKKIIKKDDYSIFEGGDERVIILLTCVSDDLRLVVTCK